MLPNLSGLALQPPDVLDTEMKRERDDDYDYADVSAQARTVAPLFLPPPMSNR